MTAAGFKAEWGRPGPDGEWTLRFERLVKKKVKKEDVEKHMAPVLTNALRRMAEDVMAAMEGRLDDVAAEHRGDACCCGCGETVTFDGFRFGIPEHMCGAANVACPYAQGRDPGAGHGQPPVPAV